jgi:hypothetical protein
MTAQQGVDDIRAFQGGTDGALDPNAHADALQKVVDGIFPPTETGSNVIELELLVVSGNTQDSVAPVDIDTYVTALTNSAMIYPNPIYNTGKWSPSTTEIKTVLTHTQPRSSKFVLSGTLTSDSATNTGFIGVRLSDSVGVLTGSDKRYSTGRTNGALTVNIGFSLIGYATLTNGQGLHLEISKDFAGSLVLEDLLFTIKPLW